MNNTFIALTIGPIYKTFHNVRKTRELWAASFCFSFIIRTITEKLLEKGIKKEDFIMPFFKDETLDKLQENGKFNKIKGYGMFPDRLIFISKAGDVQLLEQSIDESFDKLGDIIAGVLNETPNITNILQFLKNYFQVSYIEKSLDANSNENIILALSPYLDTLEQQNKFIPEEPTRNYLNEFFKSVNKRDSATKKTFLDDHYEIKDINDNIRVESLIEITTRELIEKITKNDFRQLVNKNLWKPKNENDVSCGEDNHDTDTDSNFLKGLIEKCNEKFPKKEDNPFSAYHKYYCIINADGDKMGTTLKGLLTTQDVQLFGDRLAQWAIDTYKKVKEEYNGVPIYIGGDDLLCIVPVANGKKNVFDLIKEIDGSFKAQFPDEYPTLSFGLSITYYKYPLSEALDNVGKLLKKAKESGGNAVVSQIIKHSGNEMVTVFHKSSELYSHTLFSFLNLLLDKESANSSIAYKIRENEKVFELIGNDEQKVINFINHITGAEAEKGADYDKLENNEKFMFLLKQMIYRIYKHKAEEVVQKHSKEISDAAIKDIYSMLRIVKFVKGLDDDKS